MLRMGHRVQFSVYAVVGTPVMLAELNRDLRRLAARGAHIVMVDLGLSAVAAVSVTEFGAPLARNRSVLRSVEVPRGWV